jgi:hypothetical protein
MLRHRLFWPLALATALGCGAGETNGLAFEEWSFTGTWRGGFVDGNARLSAVLTLTEADSALTGSGAISGSGRECEVVVDGARNGEAVALELRCAPYAPIHYRGNRTGATRIEGRVFGSGLPLNRMELIKQ